MVPRMGHRPPETWRAPAGFVHFTIHVFCFPGFGIPPIIFFVQSDDQIMPGGWFSIRCRQLASKSPFVSVEIASKQSSEWEHSNHKAIVFSTLHRIRVRMAARASVTRRFLSRAKLVTRNDVL